MPRTMTVQPGHDLLVYCLGMENKPLLGLKRPICMVNYLSKGQPCGKRVKGCSWAELPRPGFYRLGLPLGIWEEIGTDLSLQLLAPGLQQFYFRPYPGVLGRIEGVDLPSPPEVSQQIKNG